MAANPSHITHAGDVLDTHPEHFVDTTPISLPEKPRILIIKMWAIGDILMATPLLRALHRQYPGCSITWFADKRYASAVDGNPLIDDVVAFDSTRWRTLFRYGQMVSYLRMSLAMVADLKRRRFDAVINLTAEKWWVVWFQVAPVRIGLFPRWRPGIMGRLYTKTIGRGREPMLHNSEHYLLPAPALGVPPPYDRRISVAVRDEDRSAVREFLERQANHDPKKAILVLHPGASHYTKCWPAEHFARLIDLLAGLGPAEPGRAAQIVLTGSPDERPLADKIAASVKDGPKPIVAAGELPDLRQTVALVEMADAVVTGDTSVLHIASALDKPMVAIYGSTRPRDNAPLFGDHVLIYNDDVPCSPCYKSSCPLAGDEHLKCVMSITPERVCEALQDLMNTKDTADR